MLKAETHSDRLADSTSVLGTTPNAEGPPLAEGVQDPSWMDGPEATGAATVMAKPEPTHFYSTAEVAEMFGRQPRTVRHWIARGLLKCTKVGKAVFISEQEIDALVTLPKMSDRKIT